MSKNNIIGLAGFCALLLILGAVLGVVGTYRTISNTTDNLPTFIKCSNGNIYNATWANLKAAVDSLSFNGGTIYVPVCNLTVTSTLWVNHSIIIEGCGYDTIFYSTMTGGKDIIRMNPYYDWGTLEGAVLRDICIIGTGSEGAGINFTGASTALPCNSIVENVKIINVGGNGIKFFGNTYYNMIIKPFIYKVKGSGILFDGSTDIKPSANTIVGGFVSYSGKNGIEIQAGSGITISGITVDHSTNNNLEVGNDTVTTTNGDYIQIQWTESPGKYHFYIGNATYDSHISFGVIVTPTNYQFQTTAKNNGNTVEWDDVHYLGTSNMYLKIDPSAGLTFEQAGGATHFKIDSNGKALTFVLTPITTPPTGPSEGQIYYNSATHKAYCYDGATWQALW